MIFKNERHRNTFILFTCAWEKNAIWCIIHSLSETAWFFPRILEFGTIYVTSSPKDLFTCFLLFCQFYIFHFHIFSFQVTKPQNLVTLPYLSATATAEIQVDEKQVNVNVEIWSNHPTSAPLVHLGPPWSNFHPPWPRSNHATWSRSNHACYEPSFPHLLAHELVGSIPKYNCGRGWKCGMRALQSVVSREVPHWP